MSTVPEDVIEEVRLAHESGVEHVRLGGMTDTYTYMGMVKSYVLHS